MNKSWNFSNNYNEPKQEFNISDKLSSVILIDNNEIDNFVNTKLLEYYGVTNICAFTNIKNALAYLKETENTYQLILVGLYMPIAGGFEFIDEFQKLELNKKHGKVLLLSAFYSPIDIEMAIYRNVQFIDKPLKIEEITKCLF
jgi:CheY-like chemotaxis protein